MHLIQYNLFKLYDYNQFRTMNQNKIASAQQSGRCYSSVVIIFKSLSFKD